ncbi:MAG TPA: penicillin-insensitive murein endopeptidase [Stellaceae bacterium]|jgi:penicillin-insensitive murein endopeptidase
MRLAGALIGLIVAALAATSAYGQDTAAQDAARRQALLAHLPADAAKRVFGGVTTPYPGPPRPIGAYAKGCQAGAVALPADGPAWQVMRPSRNRAWGQPSLIAGIEALSAKLPAVGWPGLLVGDIAQPRGGPMITGHESHQIGLDVDLWITPMPDRRLTPAERDTLGASNLVINDGTAVDPRLWGPQYLALYKTAARMPETARIFANAAIKRQLCREAGTDRDWLRLIRPWWGHADHFHWRIKCPARATECENQAPPPPGDGCGKELDWWFTEAARHPKPGAPKPPMLVSDLPAACAALVATP